MIKITPYLHCIILLVSITNPCLFAQEKKQEVETSINKSEIPAEALSILNQFWNDEKKADFYREFDGQSVSYEAKFKLDNYLHSIEFDENGTLLDIELLINFDEISENTGNAIKSYLNDQYTKFRITRVQRQYSSDEDDLTELFLQKEFDDLTIRYELEVEAQNKEELGAFEFLFNKNGQLIRKREIVRRSLDNIW
ncbi:MAG TPA: hypothetical protein VFM80_11105 [Gracilimonas sp.]|uniref:hypothetical protein n=1 Tax=Gracilimonas sp. TaxID=1974203 RepID=UPI002D8161A6|nr:hypothetical protein [Gracilimonas sp.]